MNNAIKLGFAPTRRTVFSREDAVLYKNLIKKKLEELNICFVDIDWLNEDGLLFHASDADKVADKFIKEGIDALFTPHCNFGTEDAIAKLAKKINKPLLLWGPRDEAPIADGTRLRDSQCGLFATSKVLARMGIQFTYIENSRLNTSVFDSGITNFCSAASIVKSFKAMRIGQIGTRPGDFWSVICNEGELLERFGIEIVPVTLSEIVAGMEGILKNSRSILEKDIDDYKKRGLCNQNNESVFYKLSALKHSINNWAKVENLDAIAIQCWNTLQSSTGIMPCFANSELTGEGLPVVCETDICGAVSAVIAKAAVFAKTPVFFADLTIRHPENNNAELLWHCGPFPYKLKKEGAEAAIGEHYVLESKCPGVAEWEIKGGDISICRFDGCNGKYSIFAAEGKGIVGPKNRGTYVWVEFDNWPEIERKIIYGPYIHHVSGVHGKILDPLAEAMRYIPGVEADFC